jgi:hypothetical protein
MAFINQGRHIGTVGFQPPATEGGLITYYGNYKIHTFVECLDFLLLGSQSVLASILLVAGGGGVTRDSGGGGGGMLEYDNFIMNPGKYYVCPGAGGNAVRGESSLIHVKGDASTKMTGTISGTAVTIGDAIGGGCHLPTSDPNYNTSWPAYPNQYATQHGGSGGGGTGTGSYGGSNQMNGEGIDTLMHGWSSGNHFGTSGSRVGQGYDGSRYPNAGGMTVGGGGGGAGAASTGGAGVAGNPGQGGSFGGRGGNGGQPKTNSYRDNTAQWYAGGGGGDGTNGVPSGPPGQGRSTWSGNGGGGDSGGSSSSNGTANTGGGGHGAGASNTTAGIGGSGIIVIRVPEPLIS